MVRRHSNVPIHNVPIHNVPVFNAPVGVIATPSQASRATKEPFQFRLRTLLVITAQAAIVLAIVRLLNVEPVALVSGTILLVGTVLLTVEIISRTPGFRRRQTLP